ncbi:unnamed protein product [Effrenium voratum]|uniref:Uncharacterized protein n=1 Tax=Effrenium voratum TaxID=2562239 RepID=A0AA36HLK2_9DINO|nr:unnamed protein product [Effrenium voratum]
MLRLAALFRLAALAENAPRAQRGGKDVSRRRIGDCDLQLLLTLHRQVEPVVSEITEIHFNFTSGRHVEVTEIISMFQVDRICRSVMSVVESLRQTVGWLVCPFHFDDHSEELPEHLWPSKFLRQYFADVRMLARSGGTEVYTPEMVDEVSSAWASSEQELSALVLRLEHWSHESRRNGGRMKAETFSSVEVLIQRFMAMAVDFVRSLAEDMNAMFRAPNYVSREMTPGGAADTMESRDQESPVTVDIFSKDLSLKPEFLALLKDLPTPLIQPPGAMPQSSSMAVPQSGSYVMSSPYQQYQPQYQPYAAAPAPVNHAQGKWFAPGEALPPGFVAMAHPEGVLEPQAHHAVSEAVKAAKGMATDTMDAAVKAGSSMVSSKKKSKKKKSSGCC